MVNRDFRDLFAALNEDAWPNRFQTTFGDQTIWLISRDDLIENKRTAERPQDLLDLAMLDKHDDTPR